MDGLEAEGAKLVKCTRLQVEQGYDRRKKQIMRAAELRCSASWAVAWQHTSDISFQHAFEFIIRRLWLIKHMVQALRMSVAARVIKEECESEHGFACGKPRSVVQPCTTRSNRRTRKNLETGRPTGLEEWP